MSNSQSTPKDHWSSEKYKASASFVPNLASQILKWLDPQPTDRILDIGCGDGKFTAHFIPAVTSPEGEIHGIDSSAQFIREANEVYGCPAEGNPSSENNKPLQDVQNDETQPQQENREDKTGPKISFSVLNAQKLSSNPHLTNGTWDKVISNAALHWILCINNNSSSSTTTTSSQSSSNKEEAREKIFRDIYSALKPSSANGSPSSKFIFEFGGAGNVSEIVSVVVALLRRDGFGIQEIRDEILPWFFPDPVWLKNVLERVGFRVDVCELVDRPTKLNQVQRDGDGKFVGGGVEGWVRLMLAGVIDFYEARMGEERREIFIKEITEAVEYVADRSFDGSGEGGMWLQYVRLRGVATKV